LSYSELTPFSVDLAATSEQAVENTMKQVQGTLEQYSSWLQQTMSTTPWGKMDFVEKYKNYVEHSCVA
jgi:hypothetical protein